MVKLTKWQQAWLKRQRKRRKNKVPGPIFTSRKQQITSKVAKSATIVQRGPCPCTTVRPKCPGWITCEYRYASF